MTTQATTPPGADLHLGGEAWAHPSLEPRLVPITDVTPYPGNPRRGDQDAITASIRDLGLYTGVVVQRSTGHIVVGNHRRHGLVDLGADLIPVDYLDVDDTRAAAIVARDNRTSDLGGYNDADLLALLTSDPEVLALSGYDDADLAVIRESVAPSRYKTRPDDTPDVADHDPITRLGDVWTLGTHRLVCGDATSLSDVRRLLGSDRAALVFTDPPYGVSYVGKTKDRLTIANDALDPVALRALLDGAFLAAEEALAPGAAFYVCAPAGNIETIFRNSLDAAGLPLRQQIVWVKDRFVLGRSDYQWQHETVFYGTHPGGEPTDPPPFDVEHDTLLYGWKPGAAHTWTGGRKQTTVWHFDRPSASRLHPTMKPVALVQRAIENNTEPGAVVLDQFGGSGSTLIACERSGRAARLLELDPAYADVICRRYQQHTGLLPTRDGVQVDFTQAA